MVTKRIRAYNAVICPNSAIHNMLLTDKELKRMTREQRRDLLDGAKLAKARVYNTDVYYCFGARFATAIKKYIAEK